MEDSGATGQTSKQSKLKNLGALRRHVGFCPLTTESPRSFKNRDVFPTLLFWKMFWWLCGNEPKGSTPADSQGSCVVLQMPKMRNYGNSEDERWVGRGLDLCVERGRERGLGWLRSFSGLGHWVESIVIRQNMTRKGRGLLCSTAWGRSPVECRSWPLVL